MPLVLSEQMIVRGRPGIIRAMRTVERHPELFRTEEWSPPRGTRTASWIAVMAGAFFGPLVSDFSGFSFAEELPFLLLLAACTFAAVALQVMVLRRGGAQTRLRWSDSNVMRVFGPLEIEGGKVERAHFAAAAVLPTVLLLMLFAGYLMAVPEDAAGIAAVALLGAGFGMSLKQLVYAALALRRPPGTLIEELEGGTVRFHRPTFARL